VIDRAQAAAPQQLRQPVGIHLVALVPLPGLPPPIADDDSINERRDQIVQPLRLGPFLKGDVHGAAHAAEELPDRGALRRQHAPGNHAAALLSHRRDGACLVDIERDILGGPFHESRSLLWSTGPRRLHGSSKGRALNMR
jgi:hypothetical protein